MSEIKPSKSNENPLITENLPPIKEASRESEPYIPIENVHLRRRVSRLNTKMKKLVRKIEANIPKNIGSLYDGKNIKVKSVKNIGLMDKIIEAFFSLTPVYVGFLICWLSKPLTNRLKKLGLNKTLSAFVSLIIIFGLIIALFAVVIPIFVSQLTTLIQDLPNLYKIAVDKINDLLINTLHFENGLQITENLQGMLKVQDNLENIVNYSINTLQSVLGVLITIGTTIVVSFFMVKDFDKIKANLISILSKNKKNEKRYNMIMEIDDILMSYIKGIVIDSVIVGILTTIVCMVLKLDYAILFGILIMVLNLIPYIGAIISYATATLYAFTVGGPVLAVITLICLVIVQIIDANILQPNIVAKSVNLHPVVVLAGLIVFEIFFGIFGMIISVPVLACIKIILKYKYSVNFEELELDSKNKNEKENLDLRNKRILNEKRK